MFPAEPLKTLYGTPDNAVVSHDGTAVAAGAVLEDDTDDVGELLGPAEAIDALADAASREETRSGQPGIAKPCIVWSSGGDSVVPKRSLSSPASSTPTSVVKGLPLPSFGGPIGLRLPGFG